MVAQEIHKEGHEMKDMLEVLRHAKQKKAFANQEEFKDVLMKIQFADATLRLDWDEGAGEEWARFSNQTNGIVCMINIHIRLVFVRNKYNFQNLEHIIDDYEVVFTEDYYSGEWSINVAELKQEIPEIYWHASEAAVNAKCFSLDDFYFATV